MQTLREQAAAGAAVRPALLILAVVLGTVLVPLNSTMIAVDLPDIARSLGHGLAATVWVVSVYLIVMAVVQPIAGRTGDLYGHRRIFVAGLFVFLAGSLLAATSSNLPELIVYRAVQALGGGIAGPNGTAILRRQLAEKLPRVLGTVGMVQGAGAAAGPLLGAILVVNFGWAGIFWINVPILAVGIVLALLVIPKAGRTGAAPPDVVGALLLAGLLVALTLGIRNHPVLLILVALCLIGFVEWERRRSTPLIDVTLFRQAPFRSSNLGITLQNFLMYSVMLATPVILARQHEAIALSGLYLLLFSLTGSACSWVGGRLTERFSRRALVSTAFLISFGTFLGLALVLPLHDPILNGVWMVVAGVGSGVGGVSIQATTLQSVDRSRAGMAAGVYSAFRYLGSTLAAAVLAALPGLPPVFLALLLLAAALGVLVAQGFRGFRPLVDAARTEGVRA
ncbi:MAG: MFS transporter [Clostridia bacterium]